MNRILAIISALLILPTAVMADGLGQKKQTDIPDGLSGRIIRGNYPRLPFYFIKNTGQTDPKVKYYEQGRTHSTYFTQDGVYLALTVPQNNGPEQYSTEEIKLSLIDSNEDVEISGEGLLSGKVNYLKGGLANRRTNIPAYGAVLYKDIYDGIDLKFHGKNNVLEYDVIVNQGADPREAVFSYRGVKGLRTAPDGGLEVVLSSGTLHQKRPFIYQEIGGIRTEVAGSFRVIKNSGGEFFYGFEVSSYDASRPLVIDPEVSYSFPFGGSASELHEKIAVDPSGNVYVAGTTASLDYPVASPFSSTCNGCGPNHDVFVTKLDPTGTTIVYSTYLGGSLRADGAQSDDLLSEITVDASGSAYVTGSTTSVDFPLTPAAVSACLNTTCNHQYPDAFVTKLSPDGASLLYSSYLGGSWWDEADAVAVDQAGNIYVTGNTWSRDFPLKNQIFNAPADLVNGFVAKIDPALSGPAGLTYSTYIGGGSRDNPRAIAVDGSGGAYITGETLSTDFPVTSAPIGVDGGGKDVFVTKINPAGTALEYSTYLSGGGDDLGYAITVDSTSNAYVTGSTASTDFPVSSPYQGTNSGGGSWGYDSFLTKINTAGTALVYSTYLGGSQDDEALAIALDPWGNVFIAGYTSSADFPLASPVDGAFSGGGRDAFVTAFKNSGSALLFSTYLGGSSSETASGIAIDSSGDAYAVGVTASADYPAKNAVAFMCRNCQGNTNGFLTKIKVNSPPVFSYPAEAGYADGLVPDTGTASTAFVFKVIYTAWHNTAPSYIKACVDGVCSDMTVDTLSAASAHDGNYANGEQYLYSVNLSAGAHQYYFTASDYTGQAITTPVRIAPSVSDLAITTNTVPDGTAGYAYSASLSASGGSAPYLWSVGGGMPPGLTLSTSGIISGTPSASGTYVFSVNAADAASAVFTKTMSLTVKAKTIDLAVSSVTGPASALTGTAFDVSSTIVNSGTAASSTSTLNIYLSRDNVITSSDTYIGQRSVGAIAAGAFDTVATRVEIPGSVQPGAYYIGAAADAENTNTESNESNNTASMPVTITSGVDLAVGSIIPPSGIKPGDVISVQNTLVNNGSGTAAMSFLKFYLSDDSVINFADAFIGQRTVGNIPAGSSSTAATSLTIPSSIQPGTYYLGAIADVGNINPEYDEINNRAYTPVTIIVPAP